jgi:glycosyltransferase involved in cell wall biosynthesis
MMCAVAQSLSVLLTNMSLANYAGSEVVVRDIATGLLRRGHRPIAYAPTVGALAAEMTAKGIAVIDDLRKLSEPPDIIHAHHAIPCGEALIRFPDVPAINVCHAFEHWLEAPVHFPQIGAYVAVDEACRDRLVHAEGIHPAKVVVLPNAVDLTRVPVRTRPLAERPLKAVAFGKAAAVPEIRAACESLGIALDVIGRADGPASTQPEQLLVECDLVFASARAALESLCCGCAVIVCDARGIAGFVTSENYAALRARNFGLRSLVDTVSVERLVAEVQRYDRDEAMAVSARARAEADLDTLLDRFEALYAEVLTGGRRPDMSAEAHAKARTRFLHEHLPRVIGDTKWGVQREREAFAQRIQQVEAHYAEAHAAYTDARSHLDRLKVHARSLEEELVIARRARAEAETARADAEGMLIDAVGALEGSRLVKIGRALRRVIG